MLSLARPGIDVRKLRVTFLYEFRTLSESIVPSLLVHFIKLSLLMPCGELRT
jgi:hypothetical protein